MLGLKASRRQEAMESELGAPSTLFILKEVACRLFGIKTSYKVSRRGAWVWTGARGH